MFGGKKSILFLSALDFKDKSIQVIKRTPEAYVKAGWDVNYIVIRDNSKYDNYYYEEEINPVGVNIIRAYLPISNLINRYGKNKVIRRILQKIAYYLAVLKLFILGYKLIKKKNINIVYGYEIQGVLAANLLKLFGRLKGKKLINRFQGTFYSYYYYNKLYLKMLVNFDHFLALYLPSDLCIMTNDGTQGNKALEIVKSRSLRNYRFWVNGVDELKLPAEIVNKCKNELNPNNKIIFLSISRLEQWKRVDRSIEALSILKSKYNFNDFIYYIVGEGLEKVNLQNLAKELKLDRNVVFTSAVTNSKIKEYLNIADFFLSTYDSSNVGNPLLEAIRTNTIILTINNGDTGSWIKHYYNGFIYDLDNALCKNMAQDIYKLINDRELRQRIINNIKKTEKEKLWTWEKRFKTEIREVNALLNMD